MASVKVKFTYEKCKCKWKVIEEIDEYEELLEEGLDKESKNLEGEEMRMEVMKDMGVSSE